MKPRHYEFDASGINYRKVRGSIWKGVSSVLKVLAVSLTFFGVLYSVLAAFMSTDEEKRLSAEIRAYQANYEQIAQREELLRDAVSALEVKDNGIYSQVFHSQAPAVDPMGSMDMFYGADTIPDAKIVRYTAQKADEMMRMAAGVDSAFVQIYRALAASGGELPPMNLPVEGVSYTQIGASVGIRRNPFYNAEVQHNGLDIIVPRDTPVYAPADGTVIAVSHSGTGEGRTITLDHPGGWQTRYCHLSSVKVSVGQSVRKGREIGTTGMSGSAFAPHLHYEVKHFGAPADPVNFIFASVTPDEYSNMLYMSAKTRQSMD